MRKQTTRLIANFSKALENLHFAVDNAEESLEIDGAIKRFELCYELSWKLMKEVLADLGIIVANPKDAFKQAFLNDFISDELKWLAMIEDRNYLDHCYSSEDSRKIFGKVQEIYLSILSAFFEKIKQKIG